MDSFGDLLEVLRSSKEIMKIDDDVHCMVFLLKRGLFFQN